MRGRYSRRDLVVRPLALSAVMHVAKPQTNQVFLRRSTPVRCVDRVLCITSCYHSATENTVVVGHSLEFPSAIYVEFLYSTSVSQLLVVHVEGVNSM